MDCDKKFHHFQELDYTFIGVNKDEVDNLSLGLEPIELKQEPPVSKGDEIFIFQHPSGRPKEFSHEEVISVERPFTTGPTQREGRLGHLCSGIWSYLPFITREERESTIRGPCAVRLSSTWIMAHVSATMAFTPKIN